MANQRLDFFTIVARNYLAYAYVLGKSVKEFHPDANFSIFLMDDKEGKHRGEIESQGFTPICPAQIELPNYKHFVFKYDVTEASTGVKPFLIQYLLNQGADKVIYLDPDILCLGKFTEILQRLDDNAVVLTPHSTNPVIDDSFPDDLQHLVTGTFNLGFIGIHNEEQSKAFVAWWIRKLRDMCLNSPETGLFVDQKWVDLAPSYFSKIFIFRSKAHNVAYWNLHERKVTKVGNTWTVGQTQEPIIFMHFSGISVSDLSKVTKHEPRNPFSPQLAKRIHSFDDSTHLNELYQYYAKLLIDAGAYSYSQIPYGFATYDNGEIISPLERRLFFASPELHTEAIDPFNTTPDSFWHLCRKSGIRKSSRPIGNMPSETVTTQYGFVIKVVQWVLRSLLFLMGPEMYAKFARFMREQLILTNHKFILRRH